jgi:hypothetical protein
MRLSLDVKGNIRFPRAGGWQPLLAVQAGFGRGASAGLAAARQEGTERENDE